MAYSTKINVLPCYALTNRHPSISDEIQPAVPFFV